MFYQLFRRASRLEAHHRFAITAGFAALVFCCVAGRHSAAVQMIATWDAYAVCLLVLAWTRFFTAKPRELIRLATLQHTSRTFLVAFVLTASCASLGAVAFLLSTAKGLPKGESVFHVAAAVGTVMLSWLVVHTVFTLHYAFLYYVHPDPEGKGGGLQFPDGDQLEPDYEDFAYFSFVIGMTSQVSDVQIACRQIRRWALLHGMISFGFNAAILALSINILSGLF
jgi:uncharacterized membrane protein